MVHLIISNINNISYLKLNGKVGDAKKETEPKAQAPLEKGYKNLERQALENLIDHIAPKNE